MCLQRENNLFSLIWHLVQHVTSLAPEMLCTLRCCRCYMHVASDLLTPINIFWDDLNESNVVSYSVTH